MLIKLVTLNLIFCSNSCYFFLYILYSIQTVNCYSMLKNDITKVNCSFKKKEEVKFKKPCIFHQIFYF